MKRFPQPLKGSVPRLVSNDDQIVVGGAIQSSAPTIQQYPVVMWHDVAPSTTFSDPILQPPSSSQLFTNSMNISNMATSAGYASSSSSFHQQIPQQQQQRKSSELAKRVVVPGTNDVLCGRGSASNNHIGNRRFRDFVKNFECKYHNSCKADKSFIALQIVLHIQTQTTPPGRFLMKSSQQTDQGDDVWYEIDAIKASKKVSQRLREKKVISAMEKKKAESTAEQQRRSTKVDDKKKNDHHHHQQQDEEPVVELAPARAAATTQPQNVSSSSTVPVAGSMMTLHPCAVVPTNVSVVATEDAIVEEVNSSPTSLLPQDTAALIMDESEDLPFAADLLVDDIFDM